MKLAELERHSAPATVAFCIARVLPIAFGSTLPCTRSPASRAIVKSRKGRCGPSANNWKFPGHKGRLYSLISVFTGDAPAETPGMQKTPKMRAASKDGHPKAF